MLYERKCPFVCLSSLPKSILPNVKLELLKTFKTSSPMQTENVMLYFIFYFILENGMARVGACMRGSVAFWEALLLDSSVPTRSASLLNTSPLTSADPSGIATFVLIALWLHNLVFRFDRDSLVAVSGVESIKYSLYPEHTFSNTEPGCYNGDHLLNTGLLWVKTDHVTEYWPQI